MHRAIQYNDVYYVWSTERLIFDPLFRLRRANLSENLIGGPEKEINDP